MTRGADAPAEDTGGVFDAMWETKAWTGRSPAHVRAKEEYTRHKHAFMLDLIADRRYARALEIGCGIGDFTRELSAIVETGVAIDVSPRAITTASAGESRFDFRVADAVDFALRDEGSWDLIVISETMPYIGWRRTFFEVGWFAGELHAATRPGGRLLLMNTRAGVDDKLYRPWLIDTYRDLFRNVGYGLEVERTLETREGDIPLELAGCVFVRDDESPHA